MRKLFCVMIVDLGCDEPRYCLAYYLVATKRTMTYVSDEFRKRYEGSGFSVGVLSFAGFKDFCFKFQYKSNPNIGHCFSIDELSNMEFVDL